MHTDYAKVLHPWTLYVERQPVGSWLKLTDALAAWWEFVQSGRWAILIRESESPEPLNAGKEVQLTQSAREDEG